MKDTFEPLTMDWVPQRVSWAVGATSDTTMIGSAVEGRRYPHWPGTHRLRRSWFKHVFRRRARPIINHTATEIGFSTTVHLIYAGVAGGVQTDVKSYDLLQGLPHSGVYKFIQAPVAPERDWFFRMKNSLRTEYDGKYVAVSGEKVVDSDARLKRLLTRFYGDHGDVDVYFGYVGDEPAVPVPPMPSVGDSSG